ncbi:MAG: carbohydrate kinase family protein [Methanomicrobiales archaeon]
MKKLDIIGFGALNVDKLFTVNHIAGPDEESYIEKYSESCGGSAANTIISLSRLKIKTGFLGKIGPDQEGQMLYNNLIKEGVDTRGLITSSEGLSGKVMGFVDKSGHRALYVDPGVNDQISYDEIELEYVSNSRILHLTSFVGESINAQKELLNELDHSMVVSFDPGRIYVEKGMEYIINILERTNILLINQPELKHLIGTKYKTIEQSAKYLMDCGIDIIVVKLGKQGCYLVQDEEEYFIDPFQVNCLDTTGAGDAFNAGFIYSYLSNKSLEESGVIGNFVASCCIQKEGATQGLPDANKLEKIK